MIHILDNASLWKLFRDALDLFFGLYRKRVKIISDFGIDQNISVLDIGCGTGQFSQITKGDYLGLDMDGGYIDSAQKLYGTKRKIFRKVMLQKANLEEKSFDITLLIDLSHHITDNDLSALLASLAKITKQYIVIADPVKQNRTNLWGRMLTFLDRGKYIRHKADELKLVEKHFDIVRTYRTKILGIEGIMIFAKPR